MSKRARLVLLVPVLWLLGSASSASAATVCDRVASTSGSDSGAGTAESPYQSAQQLADSLAPGQTGCLRAGIYSFGTLSLETQDITLAPYGTEAVTLAGHIKAYPGAANSVIEGMTLNASSAADRSGPKIYASGFVLRGNEITNNNTEICVLVGSYYDNPPPAGVVIEHNRIHHCGELPATNLHHGIYVAAARNPVIRDNWIYENADRGIQQYPDVKGALITGNVIAANGQGINFSGTGSLVTADATVSGNIVVDSKKGDNAYSGGDGPNGTGNVFRDNCVHALSGGSGIEPNARSFKAQDNLVAGPAFVNPAAGDYRLQPSSPCFAKYTGTMSGIGTSSPPKPAGDGKRRKVKLKVNRRSVERGERLKLRGRVPGGLALDRRVVIERLRDGDWRPMRTARVKRDRRFVERFRPRRARTLMLRVTLKDGPRSHNVRVRVRRPRG